MEEVTRLRAQNHKQNELITSYQKQGKGNTLSLKKSAEEKDSELLNMRNAL
jgi:hypothetical protein